MPFKHWLAALVVAFTLPSVALAQNVMIPVQGMLTDADDEPIEGDISLEFELVNGAGLAQWSSDIMAVIEKGQFSVYLGMGR